jgi:hypothetical protein
VLVPQVVRLLVLLAAMAAQQPDRLVAQVA